MSSCIPHSAESLQTIQSNVSTIILSDKSCNDQNYTVFEFSRFTSLKLLEIKDYSFGSVVLFKIDGLSKLKSLKIGLHSFTKMQYGYGCDEAKSFHILNCEKLRTIEINQYSFSDFGGQFELKNLPSLRTLKIGEKEKESNNFYHSSFIIRGISLQIV